MYELLDHIDCPADIRKLTVAQLEQLCREVRNYMIECCAVNPGHLASSLGAVELIVGFHYVFDTPADKIVFDVGHQAYAHKILTGRRQEFRNLRTQNGISGFPRMDESPYDNFGAGHSSTSISAALGLAEAGRILKRNCKVAALIGDGALTGGLAFEGINNAGASNADLLVILNDNNQSIDPNKGGLHNYLLRITTSNKYNRLKNQVWTCLGESRFRDFLQRWVRSFKSWLVKKTGGDMFESFGLRYFGPIDGNDIRQVIQTMRVLRKMDGPRLMHCITVKGRGYAPAEADPVIWHAPGKFRPETGDRILSEHDADRYQDVFGRVLADMAAQDKRVVGITPAMASGCGMNILATEHPAQFFDVGIEEEHAVTFSAGLAAGGMRPFCNIYSAFSQRAYDQIIHDAALQKLPVTLCFDRAGLVGEDGATHHGAFDLAAYRSIPDVTISAPRNEPELKNLMYTALNNESGPFIIRYPRGTGEGAEWKNAQPCILPVGKAVELASGSTVAIIGTGPVVNRALEAAERMGGKAGVYNFRFLKPLDGEMLERIAGSYKAILTLEDGCLKGGLFGAVCEYMAEHGHLIIINGAGIPDRFIPHGRQSDERHECGLDTESIFRMAEELAKKV